MPYYFTPLVLAVLAQLGVEPYEVLQALAYGKRRPLRAYSPAHRVYVMTITGRTNEGRALMVVIGDADGFDRDVRGARWLTPEEEVQFEQWERSRP